MIEGVTIRPLRKIPDERGTIMHIMKATDPEFKSFGEVYVSTVYPGVIKAWHLHPKMELNYAVPVGMIKLVLFDQRPDSPTRGELMEIFMGEHNYSLVHVPTGVVNGFKGMGDKTAVVVNCASIPHDPQEIIRMDPFTKEIPYDWELKHR